MKGVVAVDVFKSTSTSLKLLHCFISGVRDVVLIVRWCPRRCLQSFIPLTIVLADAFALSRSLLRPLPSQGCLRVTAFYIAMTSSQACGCCTTALFVGLVRI